MTSGGVGEEAKLKLTKEMGRQEIDGARERRVRGTKREAKRPKLEVGM